VSPPLDVADLVAGAETTTGLSDWGDPGSDWREGLEVLIDSLESEARLSDTGRLVFESRLGHSLEQRLSVIDWRTRFPEVVDEAIDAPVIITGLPRTGTTALSNLLAQDPATRSLRVWESGAPTPPPETATEHNDPRIAATQAGLDMFEQMVPAMKTMHHDTATDTAEAIDLLGMSFRTHHFAGMADVPAYDRWWLGCDMEPAYRFHRDVLQLLQWRCPPHRWHLKNPPDLFCLDAVAAVYPDVRFIWTHRDPAAVLPSVASLIATVQTMSTDTVDAMGIGSHQLDLWATAVERGMAWRATSPEPFVDVFMRDLVADPIAAVARLYADLGWEFTTEAETAMTTWIRDHPPGQHGEHSPVAADFGLDPARIGERFEQYRAAFDVEEP
jgi:sulfotransferase family protein